MTEKPRAVLDDMPLHIKENIFGNLEFRDKSRCRLVSKSFKSIIECSPLVIPSVSFDFFNDLISVEVDNYERSYAKRPNGCAVSTDNLKSETVRLYGDGFADIMDFAIHDFMVIFNTFRHVEIKKLYFSTNWEEQCYKAKFNRYFAEGSLKVCYLKAHSQIYTDDFLCFMKLLKPGFLETLRFSCYKETTTMDIIVNLECFKKLRRLSIGSDCPEITGLTANDLKHLDDCWINKLDTISVEDVIMLKEEVFRKKNAQMRLAISDFDIDTFAKKFGAPNIEEGWKFVEGESELMICKKFPGF